MSMLGDLADFSLPDLFQMFERSGKTGQLSVWSLTGIYRVIFYQGRIVAAISPDPKYALKAIVLGLGSLSDTAVQDLKSMSELSEPLGKVLKQKGVLNTSVLASAFRQQISIGVYPLFHLESGQFRFSAKTPIPYEEMTGMSKSSIEVAMNALRKCESHFPVYDDLPLPDSRFMRASPDLPLFKLSALEWSVLENVSSAYSVSELSQLLKADLLEVRQACCRLSKVSLLNMAQETHSPKDPAGNSVAGNLSLMVEKNPSQPEKPIQEKAASPQANKTAVNSTLLSRFASMLKGIS